MIGGLRVKLFVSGDFCRLLINFAASKRMKKSGGGGGGGFLLSMRRVAFLMAGVNNADSNLFASYS